MGRTQSGIQVLQHVKTTAVNGTLAPLSGSTQTLQNAARSAKREREALDCQKYLNKPEGAGTPAATDKEDDGS